MGFEGLFEAQLGISYGTAPGDHMQLLRVVQLQ